MQKYSSFINKQQLHETISQLVENTKEKHKKLGQLCYIYDRDGIKLDKTDTYQFFLSNLNPQNPAEKMIYELLLRTMYQTEINSGNSSYYIFAYSLELLQRLIKSNKTTAIQESVLQNQFMSFWNDKLKPLFEQCSIVCNESTIKNTIELSCHDNKELATVIYETLMLAGLEGKIFVENGKQPNYVIELKNGYTFKSVEPFKFLLDNETSWNREQVKVLVLDGMIEEVSEIDHLLNKAHETSQPLLIVTMGYGEEVAATCKMNNDKGLFDVQLLKFTNDVWSLNVANDIAIVCGTTPFSSLQGHVTSFINWDELPTIDKVQVGLKQSSFVNKKAYANVMLHMKTILDKKKTANALVEDIQNIYDERLKSLASGAVYLYLPLVSEIENKSLRITIDNILRNVKTLLNYGIFNKETFLDNVVTIKQDNELEKYIVQTLVKVLQEDFQNKKEIPLLTVSLGTLLATKLCLMIATSNGYVSFNETRFV